MNNVKEDNYRNILYSRILLTIGYIEKEVGKKTALLRLKTMPIERIFTSNSTLQLKSIVLKLQKILDYLRFRGFRRSKGKFAEDYNVVKSEYIAMKKSYINKLQAGYKSKNEEGSTNE
jgi:hypothetical protein